MFIQAFYSNQAQQLKFKGYLKNFKKRNFRKLLHIILSFFILNLFLYTLLSSFQCLEHFEWCIVYTQNDINWNTAYMLAYNCIKSTKLREFQFKLLHRRIPTNDFLARIGVKESPNCSFCNEDPESLHHLLWSCSKTKFFLDRLLLKLKNHEIVPDNYVLETAVAIGLKSDLAKSTCQLDFCFLIA